MYSEKFTDNHVGQLLHWSFFFFYSTIGNLSPPISFYLFIFFNFFRRKKIVSSRMIIARHDGDDVFSRLGRCPARKRRHTHENVTSSMFFSRGRLDIPTSYSHVCAFIYFFLIFFPSAYNNIIY